MKLKPNIVLTTGSMWDAFFTKVDVELHSGKTYDFSCAKCWIIGGEGTTPKKLKKWNLIMNQCKGHNIFSGYGSSELFSAIGVDTLIADSNKKNDRPVLGVGIPYAGLTAGVFDNMGKELSYNQRGELWVKSKSAMKGYYNKPDLTAEVLVDGWIHTGDLAEISEDGFIYIYGRCKDSILNSDGSKVYLFDIENEIKQDDKIGDAIVLTIPELNDATKLFAHIEWLDGTSDEEKASSLVSIDKHMKEFLPSGLSIEGYAEHKRLPYSPTTLKKDKNKLSKQKDGYFTVR
jgi:acyl-CoA synthetase (AMP-forming)/AMP-acid ligase II